MARRDHTRREGENVSCSGCSKGVMHPPSMSTTQSPFLACALHSPLSPPAPLTDCEPVRFNLLLASR